MKRYLVATFTSILLLLVSCTPTEETIAAAIVETQAAWTPVPTQAPLPTYTAYPTYTPFPTNTALPTNTSVPINTDTPAPTNTPKPTNTPTPEPEPIVFTGSGDSVVDLDDWPRGKPAVIHIVNSEPYGDFIVENYNENGEKVDFISLVEVEGIYDGYVPMDFESGEETVRLLVTASGDWLIEVIPTESDLLNTLEVPGTYEGEDSDVIFLTGKSPDIGHFKSGPYRDNVFVGSYGTGSGRAFLVNEPTPYEGTFIFPDDTFVVIVSAEESGPWTLEVQAK